MTQENLTLPPNADPLLPSQHRTAINQHIETQIDSLTGVDSSVAGTLFDRANLNSLELQNRPDGDPVLVTDYLRVRADDTLALHPIVRQVVAEEHHDQLLKDLVQTYHDNLYERDGTTQFLEPFPGFPEPVLDALNEGYDVSFGRTEFALSDVADKHPSRRDQRSAPDYPIQVHDILADLRAEGIVTSLAESYCEACGLEAAQELADQLGEEGHSVHGYAGIVSTSPPDSVLITVQDFIESSLTSGDIVDLVWDSAHNHNFRSDIRVETANLLRL